MGGRRVTSLVSAQMSAGPHQVEWNGRDDRGSRVASGTYLYRIETESFTATRRMTVLK